MKKGLLAFVVLLAAPAIVVGCPQCSMSIYDTPMYGQNFIRDFNSGSADLTMAVEFGGGIDGLRLVEFSVSGLDNFFVNVEPAPGSNVKLGDIKAPADTSTGNQSCGASGCGMQIAWPNCQNAVENKFAFATVTLFAVGAVPTDHVLRVLRRFPPSNPNNPYPLFTQCDAPVFTKTATTGDCFVINPSGNCGDIVDGCELICTSVETRPWTAVKELYK